MSTLPKIKDIIEIPRCSAEMFDEQYLRTIKGQGFANGYFHYPDAGVRRYLLIRDSQPFIAAWDDGSSGQATALAEYFEAFTRTPQHLHFCETDEDLITALAVSWQQTPDAHSVPGLLEPAEIIKAVLRKKEDYLVRFRKGADMSFLLVKKGKIKRFYRDSVRAEGAEAEKRLVKYLAENQTDISLDVFEKQDAVVAEDWALIPPEFSDGMVRFYCCTSPHLILMIGEKEIQRIPLTTGKIVLGRDPGCDLIIDNLSVSRRHAIIELGDGVCTVKDLGSKNGTLFQGKRIDGKIILKDTQEISVGKHVIKYLNRATNLESKMDMGWLDRTVFVQPGQLTPAQSSSKEATITAGGKLYSVKQSPFTIGASEKADLVLEGKGIKPTHALLEKDSSGQWWINHKGGLLSSTRINGKKINASPLRSGDLIQIGTVMLRFQLKDGTFTRS